MNKVCGSCKTNKNIECYMTGLKEYKTCQSCRQYQKKVFESNPLTSIQMEQRRMANKRFQAKKRTQQRNERKSQINGCLLTSYT